jgi:TatA/E family protein of Tat protein translocase
MQEIVLICVIALIVVGPQKFAEIARALGKGYGEFRRTFDEMKRNVETEFNTDEIHRGLFNIPPPAAVPEAQSQLLLTVQSPVLPEGVPHPNPYQDLMDASLPPPEKPAADPEPASTRSGSPSHG